MGTQKGKRSIRFEQLRWYKPAEPLALAIFFLTMTGMAAVPLLPASRVPLPRPQGHVDAHSGRHEVQSIWIDGQAFDEEAPLALQVRVSIANGFRVQFAGGKHEATIPS